MSKETYYSVKRDLLVSKETYYSVKRQGMSFLVTRKDKEGLRTGLNTRAVSVDGRG